MKGIASPVSLADLDKFERQNPQVAVNVYYAQTEKRRTGASRVLHPIRVSKNTTGEMVDLLLVPTGSKPELESHLFGGEGAGQQTAETNRGELREAVRSRYHFCVITNMSRLMRGVRENTHKSCVCRSCLSN